MRNIAFAVIIVCVFSWVVACGKVAALTPCTATQQRMWCKGVVNESTVARMQSGINDPLCAIKFAATSCVDRLDNKAAVIEFLKSTLYYLRNYSEQDSGAVPMFIIGNTVVWAELPIAEKKVTQCAFQADNPWPKLSVVDLDSASPATFGPRLRPQGFGGFDGAGGGVDGFPEVDDDLPVCVAPMVPVSTCAHAGEACGLGATCCASEELSCYVGDTGASECM